MTEGRKITVAPDGVRADGRLVPGVIESVVTVNPGDSFSFPSVTVNLITSGSVTLMPGVWVRQMESGLLEVSDKPKPGFSQLDHEQIFQEVEP